MKHVAFALGLGDTYWACMKLRALRDRLGVPLTGHINASPNHQSVHLLKLLPYLDGCEFNPRAVYDVNTEMPPSYTDPKWATLEGCQNWNGFDYLLVANGHLERGERIETYLPELETEYNIPLNLPTEAYQKADSLDEKKPVLLYMSGRGPNTGFHMDSWKPAHWAEVIRLLNYHEVVPYLVGAPTADDYGYRDDFTAEFKYLDLQYHDLVGQTTVAEYLALIERAGVWVGLNSGGGIISAARETPTVMMWSDATYPIRGVRYQLHGNMQTSWLPPESSAWYRTLSYGSPELTPEAVVAAALEVRRQ